jgi:hypothetical protein
MNTDPFQLIFDLDKWDAATSDERVDCTLAVAESLPADFSFDRLTTFTLGDQSHEIPLFHYDNRKFSLVPGRTIALLGYDRFNPFQPNEHQLRDWQIVQSEFGCTIDDYLDDNLTPFRRVRILPLLVEAIARSFEYEQNGDEQTEGYARVQSLFESGFRLPTTDEWEYLCSGGARTLFRWGNDCPVSQSNRDNQFTAHKRQNAFGITVNSSTYDSELCQGKKIRGGDGGGSVCGGIGRLITWFPLASSFQVSDVELNGWWIDNVFARRIWPIVAEL